SRIIRPATVCTLFPYTTHFRSLTNGSCGTFSTSWTTVTLSSGNDTGVTSGNCYHYRYKISDNVGNQSAVSTTSNDAKVDTSAPNARPSTPLSSSPSADSYAFPS